MRLIFINCSNISVAFIFVPVILNTISVCVGSFDILQHFVMLNLTLLVKHCYCMILKFADAKFPLSRLSANVDLFEREHDRFNFFHSLDVTK